MGNVFLGPEAYGTRTSVFHVGSGATLFFFSPDLDEVIEHSHRVLVFFDRALVADVPRHNASVEFLGALMAGKKPEAVHAA